MARHVWHVPSPGSPDRSECEVNTSAPERTEDTAAARSRLGRSEHEVVKPEASDSSSAVYSFSPDGGGMVAAPDAPHTPADPLPPRHRLFDSFRSARSSAGRRGAQSAQDRGATSHSRRV